MSYIDESEERQNEMRIKYAELENDCWSAYNELNINDLYDCQNAEAEGYAIKEVQKEYNVISIYINKILSVLVESERSLDLTNKELKKNLRNTNDIDEISGDIENLINNMNENDINKFREIKNKLDENLEKMASDYKIRRQKCDELKNVLSNKFDSYESAYKEAYNYYYNNGMSSSMMTFNCPNDSKNIDICNYLKKEEIWEK